MREHISKRQEQVLTMMWDGYLSWQIAECLGISERTVGWHISALKQRYKAPTREELYKAGLKAGIIKGRRYRARRQTHEQG